MPNYLLQVTLNPASGITADISTNTWSFTADNVAAAELAKDSVIVFYQAIRTLYSTLVRQNLHDWKIYDRADPSPRAPVSRGTFNFTVAPSGSPLPPEVALCTSFQSAPVSGQVQARRRGRVFIGPLGTSVLENTGRPFAATITTLVNATQALKTASFAAASWTWDVWSGVTGTPATVSTGWVDNEFDTQRRRGRDATARTTWT